jgi:hypothetical protein
VTVSFATGCVSHSMTRPEMPVVMANPQRARFSTTAPPEIVRANVCALNGTFLTGDKTRSWFVTAGAVRCVSRPDAEAIPLYVYMGDDFRSVVLEAAADDIPEETLRGAVTSTGLSLKEAIRRAEETREARDGNNGGGHGHAVAAAATGGGLVAVGIVVIVVAVVGAVCAAFVALFGSIGKALH